MILFLALVSQIFKIENIHDVVGLSKLKILFNSLRLISQFGIDIQDPKVFIYLFIYFDYQKVNVN